MDASILTIENGFQLNDGNKIPVVGLGTFELEPGDITYNSVLHGLEAGYRHIDAARLYMNEASTGKAIHDSGVDRDDLFVTSKVWIDRCKLGGKAIRESVEQTLRSMKLDYLDLLLIHWPVNIHEAWEAFQDIREAQLVKSIGVSNFRAEVLEELLSDGGAVPAVDQMEHHPYMQDAKTMRLCSEKGIVYEAWSPLGRGKSLNDETLLEIAAAHDADAAQVIVSWMHGEGVVSLPRSSKPERVVSNLHGLDFKLTDEEVAAIRAMNRNEYLLDFACPNNFDILLDMPSPTD